MQFLGTATVNRIYLKHQIVVRAIYFFEKVTWSCLFYKVVWPAIHSFKRTGFFWGISWRHLLFHVGDLFHGAVSGFSYLFFQELNGSDNFWHQLLTMNNYFFGRAILVICFFNGSLFFTTLITAILPLKKDICFCQRMSSSHRFFRGYCINFGGRYCSHPLFE